VFLTDSNISPESINGVLNSSPTFKSLVGDYACLGQNFNLDFSATDPDGDSLFYSLSVPLEGVANPNLNIFSSSKPYAPIKWATGFDRNNIIPATVPLQIKMLEG
jgi:hypothetical protein